MKTTDERIGMYILLMSNRTQGLIKLEEDRNKIEGSITYQLNPN